MFALDLSVSLDAASGVEKWAIPAFGLSKRGVLTLALTSVYVVDESI